MHGESLPKKGVVLNWLHRKELKLGWELKLKQWDEVQCRRALTESALDLIWIFKNEIEYVILMVFNSERVPRYLYSRYCQVWSTVRTLEKGKISCNLDLGELLHVSLQDSGLMLAGKLCEGKELPPLGLIFSNYFLFLFSFELSFHLFTSNGKEPTVIAIGLV